MKVTIVWRLHTYLSIEKCRRFRPSILEFRSNNEIFKKCGKHLPSITPRTINGRRCRRECYSSTRHRDTDRAAPRSTAGLPRRRLATGSRVARNWYPSNPCPFRRPLPFLSSSPSPPAPYFTETLSKSPAPGIPFLLTYR